MSQSRRTRRHLQPEGLHPADDAVPRPVRLLHLRQGPGPHRRARTSRPTRCSPSPPPAPRSAATRRCSPSARPPRSATPSPATWLADQRLRVDRRLPRRHVPARPRRDRPAPPRQRRRPRRTPTSPPLRAVVAEPGDDDRDAAGRPRRPPRRARQDARAPPRHPRGGRRARHPVHHRHPRRHRRGPGRPRRGARGHRRQPPPPRPRAGGDRPELPAEAGHGDARVAAVPARRASSTPSASPATILPADVLVQAPPNLSEPDQLADLLARRHRRLGRRLARSPPTTSTPSGRGRRSTRCAPPPRPPASSWRPGSPSTRASSLDPERWLDAGVRFAVLDRSDAEGLGRDDPGAVFPERIEAAIDAGSGAEVVQIGRRNTAWYSRRVASSRRRCCRTRSPWADGPRPRGPRRRPRRPGARRGRARRPVRAPAAARSAPSPRSPTSCAGASSATTVTWVRNRNINYTNVCTFKCRFCGFSKGPLSLNLRGTPYLLTLDDIAGRVREARDLGATEVCLQGGIHPSFDGDYYIDVARAVKDGGARHPRPRLHRPRGHRGRQAPRRAARRLPAPAHGRRPAQPARHRRRDPRRRGPRRPLPRQDQHRGVARGPPHRPLGRAAQQRHDHVRLGRAAAVVGPAPRRHPRPPEGDRRLHRVRRPARSCTWRRRSTSSARPVGARPSARRCSCTPSPASPTAS